jgi:ribosomal protein L11 methyltransferase
MAASPLWNLSVTTASAAEEAVAEIMNGLFGRPASSYTDFRTGTATVSVFFTWKPDFGRQKRGALNAALDRLERCGIDIGPRRISLKKIPRRDWAESWKRHFKPIQVGSVLLIKPSWSAQQPKKNQAVVVLDPGLSFGTGQHPTTAFCLEQLAALARRDQSQGFLDIGTGSGILAIAAAKLGYAPVEAFDNDPAAVRIAGNNARRNRTKIRIRRRDVTKLPERSVKRYELVCANLISTILIKKRHAIIHQVKPGGTLVVAGILAGEFPKVKRAFYAAGMKLVTHRRQNEWQSASFLRK